MYHKIINVKHENDYTLYLLFDNLETRLFDLKPYLNFGIFSELKDKKLFDTVRISFDSIEWDNNADLDPEFLYKESTLVKNANVFV
jgi:hypothetical protein